MHRHDAAIIRNHWIDEKGLIPTSKPLPFFHYKQHIISQRHGLYIIPLSSDNLLHSPYNNNRQQGKQSLLSIYCISLVPHIYSILNLAPSFPSVMVFSHQQSWHSSHERSRNMIWSYTITPPSLRIIIMMYHHHQLLNICTHDGFYHYHLIHHLQTSYHTTPYEYEYERIICLRPPQHTHISHNHTITITIIWNIHHILSSLHETTIGNNNKRNLSTWESQQLFYLKFYLLWMIVWQMMPKSVQV